jgi:hypothetical protein
MLFLSISLYKITPMFLDWICMKKLFLLISSCLVFGTIDAWWWDGTRSLAACLKAHADAFSVLEPHASKIVFSEWREFYGNTTVYNKLWRCPSYEAKASLGSYQAAEGNLSGFLFESAVGDGFCAGAVLAVLNNMIGAEVYNTKTLGLLGVSATGIILYQNYTHQGVSYFDMALKRQDNYFSNFGSIPRILSAMVGGAVGYLGTAYALTKISEIYRAASVNIAKK